MRITSLIIIITIKLVVSKSNLWKITFEGAVSHNALYYQPLPITHYQVSSYATAIYVQIKTQDGIHLIISFTKDKITHGNGC